MIIAVASGKGGTGKTTVAVHLASSAPQHAVLLDCDVEEPNCHLFFDLEVQQRNTVNIPVPALDAKRCTACGLCSQICQFHAVAFMGQRPVLFPELCHGCGGCVRVCPAGALREVPAEIGTVEVSATPSCTLVQGRLHVGKALSPPLIHAVKRHARRDRLTIVDCPPGTACPLAAAVSGCDFAVLVAEPTRFGLHDLGLVVEAVRQLQVPLGVVINRSNGQSGMLREYCREQGIAVLMEIPHSQQVAQSYARGRLALEAVPELKRSFQELWSTLASAADAVKTRTGEMPHAHV